MRELIEQTRECNSENRMSFSESQELKIMRDRQLCKTSREDSYENEMYASR
jgi:hypothetical protein